MTTQQSNQSTNQSTNQPTSQPVIECVVFSPNAGVEREAFVTAASGINEWARSQPGFVSRELFESGDARWVDVVRWATMEDALAAGAAASTSEPCGAFFGLIDMDNVVILHGAPVIGPVRP